MFGWLRFRRAERERLVAYAKARPTLDSSAPFVRMVDEVNGKFWPSMHARQMRFEMIGRLLFPDEQAPPAEPSPGDAFWYQEWTLEHYERFAAENPDDPLAQEALRRKRITP